MQKHSACLKSTQRPELNKLLYQFSKVTNICSMLSQSLKGDLQGLVGTATAVKNTIREANSNESSPNTDGKKHSFLITVTKDPNHTLLADEYMTPREQRNCNQSRQLFEEPATRSLERCPSEAMCTLKTQLNSLKKEIGKLGNLDGKQGNLPEYEERGQSLANGNSKNSKKAGKVRQTASVAHSVLYQAAHRDLSFLLKEKHPLSDEKISYILLENESLKLELKNLKIRYIQRKAELKDENHCLRLKVGSLEEMLEFGKNLDGKSKVQETAVPIGVLDNPKKEAIELQCGDNPAQLINRIKAYEKQLTDKQKMANSLKEQLERLSKVLESKSLHIRELETSVQHSGMRFSQNAKRMEQHFKRQFEKAMGQRNTQIEGLLKQRKVLVDTLHQRDQHIRELENKQLSTPLHPLRTVKKEHKGLKLSHTDNERRLSENAARMEQLEKIVENLKKESQTNHAKMQQNSRVIQHQQRHMTAFAAYQQECRVKENGLRAELQRIQHTCFVQDAEFKRQLSHALNERNQLVQAIDKLTSKIRKLEQALQSAILHGQTTETENSTLRQSIRNLTVQLQTMKRSFNKQQKVGTAANNHEEQLRQLKKQHQQEIRLLVESISNVSSINDQLKLRLQQQEEKVKNVQSQANKANEVSNQQQAIEQNLDVGSRYQVEALERENQALKYSLLQLDQQKSTVLNEGIINELTDTMTKLRQQLQIRNKDNAEHLGKINELEKQLYQKQKQIQTKEDELAKFTLMSNQNISSLNDQLTLLKGTERPSQQAKLIAALENKLKVQADDYDNIVDGLKQQLQHFGRGSLVRSQSTNDIGNIKDALKGRDQQIKILRESLCQRNSEVGRLQSMVTQITSELDNLKRQVGVERGRSISQRNSSLTSVDIEMLNLKSDLNIERKTNSSAMQKLKYLNQEIRKKDAFIQNFLIGKKLGSEQQINLKEFFASYEKEFPRETIHSQLFHEIKQLQRLTERTQLLERELARNGIPPPFAKTK